MTERNDEQIIRDAYIRMYEGMIKKDESILREVLDDSFVLVHMTGIVMTAAAGVLFFCTSFSGGNAVIVILTATALFWLPELAGVLLAGLVLLQRKIADTFLV